MRTTTRLRIAGLLPLVALGACASDEETCADAGGAACFVLPTAPLAAIRPDGTPDSLALGCGPLTATALDHPITITGVVTDPLSRAHVPGTQLVFYDSTALASPLDSVVSAASGTYTVTLPAGTGNVLSARLAARTYAPETLLRHVVDPAATTAQLDPYLLTPADADTYAGLIRTTYDPDKGALALFTHDCNRGRLEHAAIVISSASGTRRFIDGVTVAYTTDTELVPVLQSVRSDTTRLGAAGVVNVPAATTFYAQAWGFPDAAAFANREAGLVLLDELPFTVEAGGIVGIELHAR